MVVIYDLRGRGQPIVRGVFESKQPWTGTVFNEAENTLLLWAGNELSSINDEGS